MKVLHLADLHFNERWFDWVARECVNYGLVVFAGDLQNGFANTGLHAQAKTIAEFLTSLPTACVAVTGNHDFWTARGLIDRYADGGWLRMLRGKGNLIGVDGDIVDYHGLRICCNGWLQVPDLDSSVDLLVTHAPPAGCQSASGAEGVDVGDPELWPAVHEFPPGIVLSGHVHQPRKLACTWPPIDPSSLILVPGCNEEAAVPNHWILDTHTGIAQHSSGESIMYTKY